MSKKSYLSVLFLLVIYGKSLAFAAKDAEASTSLRGRGFTERKLQAKCGCNSCTEEVLQNYADGSKCGDRINWVVANMAMPEIEACILVAGDEFPVECGGCNPNVCEEEEGPYECGCNSCSEEVWNTLAGSYSCGSRITWLQEQDVATLESYGITDGPFDKTAACEYVSTEFPDICTCNPTSCNDNGPSPTLSPTTAEPTSTPTKSPTEAPTKSPTASPTNTPTTNEAPVSSGFCGCDACTQQVFDTYAGDYKCGDRINWVHTNEDLTLEESCIFVAEEFPDFCGVCHSDTCGEDVPTPPTDSPPSTGGMVHAMSYNTQYTGYYDGRVDDFGAKIVEVNPDVVGLQECQNPNALVNASPGYTLLGGTGPQNYILYDNDRVKALDSGWMNIPRDNYAQRTITWGKFRILSTGSEFWFFNTHLPHNSNAATDRNTHAYIARSLVEKRNELGAGTTPIIVVGDCNPFASSGASEGSFESNLAANGIPLVYMGTGKYGGHYGLDKIFATSGDWTTLSAGDHGTGRSDHPAISAELRLN